MPNGFHSHYCSRCKEEKDCAQITHCRKSPTALCADCIYDDYVAETKSDDKKEGKTNGRQ